MKETIIAHNLRQLADQMHLAAVDIGYYGGRAEWAKHGRELAGAAVMVLQWADEIETNPQA